jgi:hypothetical protein
MVTRSNDAELVDKKKLLPNISIAAKMSWT